jgi:hypothetical protein
MPKRYLGGKYPGYWCRITKHGKRVCGDHECTYTPNSVCSWCKVEVCSLHRVWAPLNESDGVGVMICEECDA